MSTQMLFRTFIWSSVLFIAVLNGSAQDVAHAVAGTVEKVDSAAKTVAIKTADGTVETVKFTGKTSVHGFKDVTKASQLAGKEGEHVVVYTGKATATGAEKTASAIVSASKESGKAIQGTVVKVDDATKTVVVKSSHSVEEAFEVSGDAVASSGKKAGQATAKSVKAGDRVTVHYTEEAGKKVAHAIVHW